MATEESAHREVPAGGPEETGATRTVPIIAPPPTIQMSAPSPGEPMELTSPTSPSAPASATKSPEAESNGLPDHLNSSPAHHPKPESHLSGNMPAPVSAPAAAAPAIHQPKIVQTAFIHKLYNMLEDPNIQSLISWAQTGESFVMSPSPDFSRVLAQYFKHTNISSFVRQLNMYGFHKVSDVFANGSESTTLWEFKHGNGNFKRGDLMGLREIKRRASRHALVHREYNQQKPAPPQPGTPAEPIPIPDGSDPRIATLEHQVFEMSHRFEQHTNFMHAKQQAISDSVSRLLYFNQELSRTVLHLVPSPDNPIHRDVVALQEQISRQAEIMRSLDEPHEPPPFSSRGQYFSHLENAPVSPRQLPQDDPRARGLAPPQSRAPNFHRPPVPSNLSISTRRPYGSIGASPTQPSPSSLRPQPPAPPPAPPHPLAHVDAAMHPGMARRHTSADIRVHNWQPAPSPFVSGPPSSQWPSSPSRGAPEDQRIRESFSSYSLQAASQPHSRPETPPPPPFSNGNAGLDSLSNWSWGAGGGGANRNLAVKDSSVPPTRRGSMAHILNPTDTAEREDEDEDPQDDRKRKRLL